MLLGSVAVAISAAQIIDAISSGDQSPWPIFVALTLLIFAGHLLNVEIRIRSTHHGLTWADTAVVIGFAVLPVPWVVVATATGIALAEAIRRPGTVKFIFGVAKDSATAYVGGILLVALGASGSLESPTSIAVLALAFIAMAIVDPLLTVPVIAAASRTPALERFRTNLDIRLITAAGRFAVVALAVLALQLEDLLLYALPVVVLIGHLWHERWVRAREERVAWQNLARATESFSGTNLDNVIHSAVTHGATLFSADQVDVETWLGLDRRLVRGNANGINYDGEPSEAPADDCNVFDSALHGYQGRRDVGVLRLRFRNKVKMSEREQAMMSSFAASLDTAIRNAAAFGQLGEATAAHAHAAAHDPLTGLANRRELERHLTEALATDTTLDSRIALLMIDLRHFKEVNDTLGHLSGDQVLKQVATRLADSAGDKDLVARFGGDEFAILLRSAFRPDRVAARARRVLTSLTEPVELDGLPLVVEANAGLALAVDPNDAAGSRPPAYRSTPESWMAELMRRADVAMYQAKRGRTALASYTPSDDTADRHRLALAGQLPQAVSQREFVLHFQPIIDLATGDVHGAEALARWRHPTQGRIEPGLFLDLLERSNHLQEFTAAVLDDALTAADMWRAAGHDLSVSVNISPRSLLDTNLPRMVLDALDAHRTPPERLCLELTETLAISQLDTVDQVLTHLHDIGLRLALDDFGTGYSSLAALSRIPVHQLKIDRSFVHTLRDAHTENGPHAEAVAQATAVVNSTVQLGRTLDLTVVAEGIENTHQRRLLWEMGCAYGQGNMFSEPVATDQLLAYLTHHVAHRPDAPPVPPPRGENVINFPPQKRPGHRERGAH